ncbi:MAG: hypothetical protein A2020_10590 [Lentisphaerae bacterium GWF2_45_14]|nr:MAG: hypothetical protein A2020_10590 [Lentisphaerae bacterium GWF2_45_14]
MANKDLTRERVKNVMHHIPKSAMKDQGKMRKTLHNSFSGMKTLINQLSEKKIGYKQLYQKKQKRSERFKRTMFIIEISITVIILSLLVFFLLTKFGIA